MDPNKQPHPLDIENEVQYTVEEETPEGTPAPAPAATPAPEKRESKQEGGDTDPDDPSEEELAQYSEQVRKRISKMTWQRHQARREAQQAQRDREEAIRVAQAIVDENNKLKQRLSSGEQVLATTIHTSATAEVAAAKLALKEAHEAFDAEQIVEAQERLQKALFKAAQAEAFQQARQRPQAPEVPAPRQPQVDPAAVTWQQQNKWFGSDEEMTAYAIGIHNRLTREHGPAYATTREYYERINARMREKFPEAFEDLGTTNAAPSAPAPTVVAPASRSGPAKRVVLTKRQIELARRLNIPVELYAKKVAELENPNG